MLLVVACGGGGVPATPAAPTGGATSPSPGVPTPASEPPTQTIPTSSSTDAAGPSPTSRPTAATTPGGPSALAWSELSPASGGPGAREDHTWTVAADGQSALLFGGRRGNTEFNDLWRYDLVRDEWSLLRPRGTLPAARFGHTAVWVESTGLVVWSGQAGTRFFADVWAYDPLVDAWRELPSTGDVPPARYGSCAGVGPDGRMWISHGFTADAGRFSDTRAYDFVGGSWSDVTPVGDRPVERCLHDCMWTPDGRLLVYAGQTTGAPAIGDLWSYEPSAGTWSQAAQPEPEPRQLYALAQVGGTAFVFGGGGRDGEALSDLWLLDLGNMSWTRPELAGSAPGGRFGAAMITDEERDRVLLLGGKRGNRELAELWQLDLGLQGS